MCVSRICDNSILEYYPYLISYLIQESISSSGNITISYPPIPSVGMESRGHKAQIFITITLKRRRPDIEKFVIMFIPSPSKNVSQYFSCFCAHKREATYLPSILPNNKAIKAFCQAECGCIGTASYTSQFLIPKPKTSQPLAFISSSSVYVYHPCNLLSYTYCTLLFLCWVGSVANDLS